MRMTCMYYREGCFRTHWSVTCYHLKALLQRKKERINLFPEVPLDPIYLIHAHTSCDINLKIKIKRKKQMHAGIFFSFHIMTVAL